jgi:hypothetical protein
MAALAKFLAVGVTLREAGAGGILVVSLPVERDELPPSIAHRLVSPMIE